ncbi:MAG: hypothetical protein ACTIC1_20715 [Brevibacterium sp.]
MSDPRTSAKRVWHRLHGGKSDAWQKKHEHHKRFFIEGFKHGVKGIEHERETAH